MANTTWIVRVKVLNEAGEAVVLSGVEHLTEIPAEQITEYEREQLHAIAKDAELAMLSLLQHRGKHDA